MIEFDAIKLILALLVFAGALVGGAVSVGIFLGSMRHNIYTNTTSITELWQELTSHKENRRVHT